MCQHVFTYVYICICQRTYAIFWPDIQQKEFTCLISGENWDFYPECAPSGKQLQIFLWISDWATLTHENNVKEDAVQCCVAELDCHAQAGYPGARIKTVSAVYTLLWSLRLSACRPCVFTSLWCLLRYPARPLVQTVYTKRLRGSCFSGGTRSTEVPHSCTSKQHLYALFGLFPLS